MSLNNNESTEISVKKSKFFVMPDSDDKESFINVKDLLLLVLKKTGIILLTAIIMGCALFGYKFVQKVKTANVLDTSLRLNSSETDVQYDIRVQRVNRAKDLADTIGRLNSQIENQRKYIADSVYMQIDSENEYEATAQFVLTLENNDTNGLDKALIGAYEREVKAGPFLDKYAESIGTRPDYIKELIVFSSSTADSMYVSIDSKNDRAGSMYVRIYGPSKDFVDNVIQLIIEDIENSSAKLNSTVAPHTVTVVGIQSVVRTDQSTRDGQVNMTSKLETLQRQINNCNEALDEIGVQLGVGDREDILNYFATHNNDVEDASSTGYSEVEVSHRSMIKPAIKLGAIGFAGGVFLAFLFIVLKYIFGKTFSTQAQFFSVFTSIRKIGVMKPSYKRSGLVKALDKKSEDDSKMTDENTKKLISANYANLTKDCKKVLITGTGDKKAMSEAYKALGLKGDYKPDIFSDPDVLKTVPDYDGVVILEQRKVSLFKDVSNEIALIGNAGTEIIGAIII